MPYNVVVNNRFALDLSDQSSSEDEGIQNMDPYAVVQKAEAEAVKKARAMIKNQAEAARQQTKAAEKAKKESEEKKDENAGKKDAAKKDGGRGGRGRGGRGGRGRGEPRGNFQARSGKRNEEAPSGESAVQEAAKGEGNTNNRRQNRRPRDQDRKPSNNRTGVKAQEKRGGAGKGNWGKQEDQAENESKPTEQAANNEHTENTKNEENENTEVPEEPQEPETPEFSLDEYYAQMSVGTTEKKAVRQANDGQEVKGVTLKKKTIYNPDVALTTTPKPVTRENAKNFVPIEKLGFLEHQRGGRDNRDRDNRGGRGGRGNRGGRGGRQNRDGERGQRGAQKFAMNEEAFPSLGGK